MFTGLIEERGTVRSLNKGSDSARLTVAANTVTAGLRLGDSIAVNGACLTVVSFDNRQFEAEIMAETLDRTNLRELRSQDMVNLERALRLGDRLGGHMVSGHIDGVGRVNSLERRGIAILLQILSPPEVLRYVVPKGSIAIDGASLTVVSCDTSSLTVSLIPHTAGMTTLGLMKVGESVNLEADIIAKYVERMLTYREDQRGPSERVTMAYLAEHGFA